MITARQSRAARALLGWTQETLADKARISLTALKRLESESRLEVYETTRDQVRRRLKQQGLFSCPRIAGKECCWFMAKTRRDTDRSTTVDWRRRHHRSVAAVYVLWRPLA